MSWRSSPEDDGWHPGFSQNGQTHAVPINADRVTAERLFYCRHHLLAKTAPAGRGESGDREVGDPTGRRIAELEADVDVGFDFIGGGGMFGLVGLFDDGDGGAFAANGAGGEVGEGPLAAEVADDDRASREFPFSIAPAFVFPDRSDGARTRAALNAAESSQRFVTGNAVDDQPRVSLKVGQGLGGIGPEDAIGATSVEAHLTQAALEFLDVVTPGHGLLEVQQPVAELKMRGDDGRPGAFATDAARSKAARFLKCADGGRGLWAENGVIRKDLGEKSAAEESLVKIANPIARGALAKGESGSRTVTGQRARNSFQYVRCCAGSAEGADPASRVS